MIRKLFLPALAAMLLAGCMSYGYDYRGGRSDYYYGQPSAESRYYGSGSGYGYGDPYGGPYGSIGYGHPGGFYGSIGYGSPYGYSRYSRYSRYGHYPRGYYGYPYGFYNGYGYGYPYDPYYYYRRPIVGHPRPANPVPPDHGQPDNAAPPPWRDLDELPRRHDHVPAPRATAPPSASRPTIVAPRPPSGRGEIIRERRLQAPEREERLEQTP